MIQAMCATAKGCRAWANAWTGSKPQPAGSKGALTWVHRGQSMLPVATWGSPASSNSTICTPPMAEQTIWEACGLTHGEAAAAPMNNANQTSMKRVTVWALRRACKNDMANIMAPGREPVTP